MTAGQKLVGVLVLMAIACFSTWKVDAWRYGKQLAELDKTKAQDIATAVSAAREEERRRQAAVDKVRSYAQEQNKAATADASAADAAGDRLHVEAGKFAASASACDAGAAERGASATRAAMVLSDLFQRADKRAGELAVAYDRARIAGLACERSYDSMRQ